jgi:hypothetical protein
MVGTPPVTTLNTAPSGTTLAGTMTCGFCGMSFAEDRGQAACRSCPLGAGCGKVRCPQCGYENVTTPPWIERLRGWLDREGKGAS